MTDNIVSEERPRSKPRFKKKKKSRAACVIRRILLVLLTVILAVLAALLGVVYVMEKGPSETARNLFVISCRGDQRDKVGAEHLPVKRAGGADSGAERYPRRPTTSPTRVL